MDDDAGQEILGSGVASLGDQSHCTVCTLMSCKALVSESLSPQLSEDRNCNESLVCGLNGYTHTDKYILPSEAKSFF